MLCLSTRCRIIWLISRLTVVREHMRQAHLWVSSVILSILFHTCWKTVICLRAFLPLSSRAPSSTEYIYTIRVGKSRCWKKTVSPRDMALLPTTLQPCFTKCAMMTELLCWMIMRNLTVRFLSETILLYARHFRAWWNWFIQTVRWPTKRPMSWLILLQKDVNVWRTSFMW